MTNLVLGVWLGFSYWIVAAVLVLTLVSALILIWLLIASNKEKPVLGGQAGEISPATAGTLRKRKVLNIIGLVSGIIALCLLTISFWA
ncbi:MAG: hypothetical protein U9P63_00965, partial [Patescibacteria group bacterium]|nr:hypothetical protein [Patescibacteria group bacterium]